MYSKTKLLPFVSDRSIALSEKKHEFVSGILLLMDISGFTSLSERLGKLGKRGTEELTKILNSYFGRMLSIIREFDGIVLKFGGDALLVGFYRDEKDYFERARACSIALMKEMDNFKNVDTLAGRVSINMKIVAEEGRWAEVLLGDENISSLLIAGNIIGKLVKTQKHAESGEIFFNGKILKDYSVPKLLDKKERKRTKRIKNIEKFLPQGVPKFIESGVIGENRVATAVFINFYGYNELNPEVDKLNNFFVKVIEITNKYSGSINKIGIDFRGNSILITFGAPISHEQATRNAVLAAMEISKISIPPLSFKIGLNTGFVYAGIVGSDYAKEYTVIGDGVNIASRLMTTSKGEAVIGENTKRLVEDEFEMVELPASKLKGKKLAVKRYTVKTRKEKLYRMNFVGREEEIDSMVKTIESGRSIIGIIGDAGIGKSRLIYEIVKNLTDEYKIIKTTANDLKVTFDIFANIIAKAAGINIDDSESVKKLKLKKHIETVDKDGELSKKIPFIGTMLFHLKYMNSIYDNISAKLRYENIRDAIVYYLEYQTSQKTVLIFDDIQFLQKEDIEILKYAIKILLNLSPNRNNITIVFAGRPKPSIIESFTIPKDIKYLKIELKPLKEETSKLLVKELLNNKPLPDDIHKMIVARTRGNPFYIEQFILNLIENKLIEEKEKQWVKTKLFKEEEIPENIWSVIMARVDRLNTMVKRCLRIGSVVGMEFNERIITEILGRDAGKYLDVSEEEGLTFKRIISEVEYIFRHIIIKDVIYNSILTEKQRKLHKSIGEAIESLYRNNINRFYEILAYHFGKANEWEKALYYSIKSGDEAKEEYKNDDAIRYYNRSIKLIKKHFPNKKKDLIDLYDKLGDVYVLIGKNEEAIKYYKKMSVISNSKIIKAKSNILIGEIFENKGEYKSAMELFNSAEAILKKLKSNKTIKLLQARLLSDKSWIYREEGDMERAFRVGNKAVKIIDFNTSDKRMKSVIVRTKAEILNDIATIYSISGKYDKALALYSDVIMLYREIGDRQGEVIANNNIGIIYKNQGHYGRAIKYYEMAMKVAKTIGFKSGISGLSGNLANVYYNLGDYKLSIAHCWESLAICEELDDKRCILAIHGTMALSYTEMGEYELAIKSSKIQLKLSKEMGLKGSVGVAYGYLGNVYSKLGDYKRAIKYDKKYLKAVEEVGDKRRVGMARGSLGKIYYYLGEYDKSIKYLKDSLNIFKEIGEQGEVGAVTCYLSKVYIAVNDYEKAEELLNESKKILESINYGFQLINVFNTLSELEFIRGKLKTAAEYANKALNLSEKENSKMGESVALLNLAKIKGVEKKSEAEDLFKKASNLFKNIGQKFHLAEALLECGKILKAMKNPHYDRCLKEAMDIFVEIGLDYKIKEVKRECITSDN